MYILIYGLYLLQRVYFLHIHYFRLLIAAKIIYLVHQQTACLVVYPPLLDIKMIKSISSVRKRSITNGKRPIWIRRLYRVWTSGSTASPVSDHGSMRTK